MKKSKSEIEKIILDFLHEHGEHYMTCAISTCWDNEPRNTPVDARNDGLNMYFVSDPGGKLENIKRNPKVCLAVFIPVGKGYMKNARGLQMWGTAEIITLKANPEEFDRGFKTIRIDEISKSVNNAPFPEKAKNQLIMIKIVPHRISYFDSTGGEPVKYIWEAES